jgi:hemolysin activation/secretion protein
MARYGLAFLLLGTAAAPVIAQVPLDRADPALATRQAPARAAPEHRAPSVAAPLIGASSPATGLLATSVRVEGAEDLPAAQLNAAAASFLGHRLSQDDLEDLLSNLSGVARACGYVFARSSIPPQTLDDGVLRVELDEGFVDEVRVTGADNRAVRAILAPLQGHAPKRLEVERQLMLVGDLPGVKVGDARFVREGAKGVLVVPISYDKFAGRAWADNRGDHELGPERVQLQVDLNGLLTDRDQLTVSGLATPIQPRELKVVSARYGYQLNESGTELAVFGSFGRTHSMARAAPRASRSPIRFSAVARQACGSAANSTISRLTNGFPVTSSGATGSRPPICRLTATSPLPEGGCVRV